MQTIFQIAAFKIAACDALSLGQSFGLAPCSAAGFGNAEWPDLQSFLPQGILEIAGGPYQVPVIIGATSVAAVAFIAAYFMLRRRPVLVAPGPDDLERIYSQYGTSETLRKGTMPTGSAEASNTKDGAPLAWLLPSEEGQEPGKRIPVQSAHVKIGRHSSNDIVLQHPTVHRHHGVMRMNERQRFVLSDLAGVNGTIINGQRCENQELTDGDVLEFGEYRLRFFYRLAE